ncbi:AAA family ATPase [bacterium]|nr:AAA family ATPase [bacterium]
MPELAVPGTVLRTYLELSADAVRDFTYYLINAGEITEIDAELYPQRLLLARLQSLFREPVECRLLTLGILPHHQLHALVLPSRSPMPPLQLFCSLNRDMVVHVERIDDLPVIEEFAVGSPRIFNLGFLFETRDASEAPDELLDALPIRKETISRTLLDSLEDRLAASLLFLEVEERLALNRRFVARYVQLKRHKAGRFEVILERCVDSDLVEKVREAAGQTILLLEEDQAPNPELRDWRIRNVRSRPRAVVEKVKGQRVFLDMSASNGWQSEEEIATPPEYGCLVYEARGELHPIEIQREAVVRMRRGESPLPMLETLLFGSISDLTGFDSGKVQTLPEEECLQRDRINEDQRAAVARALASPDFLLIQGPPGTGKTTFIAELCYQLARQGQRVLVASQANLAVDNALSRLAHHADIQAIRVSRDSEKLQEEGLDFVGERAVRRWLLGLTTRCSQMLEEENRLILLAEELAEFLPRVEIWLDRQIELTDNLLRAEQSRDEVKARLVKTVQTATQSSTMNRLLEIILAGLPSSFEDDVDSGLAKTAYDYWKQWDVVRTQWQKQTHHLGLPESDPWELVRFIISRQEMYRQGSVKAARSELAVIKARVENRSAELKRALAAVNEKHELVRHLRLEKAKAEETATQATTIIAGKSKLDLQEGGDLPDSSPFRHHSQLRSAFERIKEAQHWADQLASDYDAQPLETNLLWPDAVLRWRKAELAGMQEAAALFSHMKLTDPWRLRPVSEDTIGKNSAVALLKSAVEEICTLFRQPFEAKECLPLQKLLQNYWKHEHHELAGEVDNLTRQLRLQEKELAELEEQLATRRQDVDTIIEDVRKFIAREQISSSLLSPPTDATEDLDLILKTIQELSRVVEQIGSERIDFEKRLFPAAVALLVRYAEFLKVQWIRQQEIEQAASAERLTTESRLQCTEEALQILLTEQKELAQQWSVLRQRRLFPSHLDVADPAVEQLYDWILKAEVPEAKRLRAAVKAEILKDWIAAIESPGAIISDGLQQVFDTHANIVGTTCIYAGNRRYFRDRFQGFDCVIIDEVSKATPSELLVPALLGKKVILVGDHKQLPPILPNDISHAEAAAELGLDEKIVQHLRDTLKKSVFGELFEEMETLKLGRTLILTRQYRMHSQIMNLVNQFYNEHLLIGLPDLDEQRQHDIHIGNWLRPERHVLWLDLPMGWTHEQSGSSRKNEAEADFIVVLLERLLKDLKRQELDHTVGIISMYGSQAGLIERKTQSINPELMKRAAVRIGTVDSFQGMERDIIILSLVLNGPHARVNKFLSSANRVNVAMSRARRLLMIVGSSNVYVSADPSADKYYQRALECARLTGAWVRADEVAFG